MTKLMRYIGSSTVLLLMYCIGIVSKTHRVSAELPPQVYEEWKASATHVLYLIIDNVNRAQNLDSNSKEYYSVDGTVVGISRTIPGSPIEVGSDVEFNTYLLTSTDAGPSAPIELSDNDCIMAYLNVSGTRRSLGISSNSNSNSMVDDSDRHNNNRRQLKSYKFIIAAGGQSFDKLDSSNSNCQSSVPSTPSIAPVNDPVDSEPTASPSDDDDEEETDSPVAEPPAKTPSTEQPATTPSTEPPLSKPVTEPTPVSKPVTKPVTVPTTPVTKPVTKPVTTPVAVPVPVETPVKPTSTDPVAKPVPRTSTPVEDDSRPVTAPIVTVPSNDAIPTLSNTTTLAPVIPNATIAPTISSNSTVTTTAPVSAPAPVTEPTTPISDATIVTTKFYSNIAITILLSTSIGHLITSFGYL